MHLPWGLRVNFLLLQSTVLAVATLAELWPLAATFGRILMYLTYSPSSHRALSSVTRFWLWSLSAAKMSSSLNEGGTEMVTSVQHPCRHPTKRSVPRWGEPVWKCPMLPREKRTSKQNQLPWLERNKTHDKLGVHLSSHEDHPLVFLQFWVVVEDQLAGSVFTHRLGRQSKEKLFTPSWRKSVLVTWLASGTKKTK